MRGGRLGVSSAVLATVALACGLGGVGSAWAQETGKGGEVAVPASGWRHYLSRIESYSAYRYTDMQIESTALTAFGTFPIDVDINTNETLKGYRVFSNITPLPVLDVSYYEVDNNIDTYFYTPFGKLRANMDDSDHLFRLGAMLPIPRVGLLKIGATDTEAVSSYGVYFVPKIGPVIAKMGYEWAEAEGPSDDGLWFLMATLPYESWRFSLGASDREDGYTMYGAQIGKQLGTFLVAAGFYPISGERPAWAALVGQGAQDGQFGPSFWAIYLNNPDYRRANVQVAFGRPGVPKEALDNPFANGLYTAMFTDQMGVVLPIPARNFEEMRIWKRVDEYAQEGNDGCGGVALAVDAIDTDGGYEILQASLFYTHPKLGPLIFPHVGPVIESEEFPDAGRQDLRYGLEVGTYFRQRPADKYYSAGRFYFGLRGLSDFNDYGSVLAEFRISL